MPALRPLAQIAFLFAAGLALGILLQGVGLMPGDARAAFADLWRAPEMPVAAVLPAPLPAPSREDGLAVVPLVGDDDPTRNALRRSVIVAVREAIASPCDVDRRAAFQMSLRDYARIWAASPALGARRADFRTAFDDEAVRAIVAAHRAGLLDSDLVGRWRPAERDGLQEMLARHRASLADGIAEGCVTGQRADGMAPSLRL